MRQLLFFSLALLLASCQDPAVITNLDATITGVEEEAKLTVTGPSYKKEIDIVDGKIQDTLMITEAEIYSFAIGRQKIFTYLKAGETVSINGDVKKFASEGTFANEEHQVIAGYFQQKQEIMETDFSLRTLLDLTPDTLLITLEAGGEKLKENLSSVALPQAIADRELEAFDFRKKEISYLYPIYTDTEEADLPAGLQDPLAGVDLQDEDKFKSNSAYNSLVETAFMMSLNQDTTNSYEQVFKDKIAALPAGNIRNTLLYGTMRYLVGPNDKLEENMAFFREYSSDEESIAKMEEKYENFQDLMRGKPSPSFDYENHKGGKTTLEDLRGKYVYVDVWATWCGPCIGEIPSLKAKEEKYHDANVEFVSISIDDMDDGDKWRAMVDDRELGGTQLMADNAWKSSFPQEYQINGIPRFILIDPAGNIVSADAPRPSDDKLDELFAEEGLLQ